jgi:hypothetical protein
MKYLLVLLLLAPQCTPTTKELQWYQTCGDPVCGGHTDRGLEPCTTEEVGAACDDEEATCDLGDDCNSALLCTTEDPATNCPISLRSAKRDIQYLPPEARSAVAQRLLNTRLATYQYNKQTDDRQHFGFIIDDDPQSPAVAADGGHVDLYGYTSMAVATLQEQALQIQTQHAQLQAQQVQIDALRAEIEALKKK